MRDRQTQIFDTQTTGNKETTMSEHPMANTQYGTIEIEKVTPESFMLCCTFLDTGNNPDDPDSHEVVSHHHITLEKHDEGSIIIVDADREPSDPPGAVAMPGVVFRMIHEFLAQIAKDPTVVMTDGEQAQYHANKLMATYAANTN